MRYTREENVPRKRGTSASEFLDNLTDFLADSDGLTTEEIAEDLRAKGIDPEAAVERVRQLLKKHGIQTKKGVGNVSDEREPEAGIEGPSRRGDPGN